MKHTWTVADSFRGEWAEELEADLTAEEALDRAERKKRAERAIYQGDPNDLIVTVSRGSGQTDETVQRVVHLGGPRPRLVDAVNDLDEVLKDIDEQAGRRQWPPVPGVQGGPRAAPHRARLRATAAA
ncbi:MAG: hypothetical protein OXC11_12180, partial [Rhodospirillales bacterium]|nr:hypothetical protein [Rhodospirillales bacterium]